MAAVANPCCVAGVGDSFAAVVEPHAPSVHDSTEAVRLIAAARVAGDQRTISGRLVACACALTRSGADLSKRGVAQAWLSKAGIASAFNKSALVRMVAFVHGQYAMERGSPLPESWPPNDPLVIGSINHQYDDVSDEKDARETATNNLTRAGENLLGDDASSPLGSNPSECVGGGGCVGVAPWKLGVFDALENAGSSSR